VAGISRRGRWQSGRQLWITMDPKLQDLLWKSTICCRRSVLARWCSLLDSDSRFSFRLRALHLV
jgi:hypothetical protein